VVIKVLRDSKTVITVKITAGQYDTATSTGQFRQYTAGERRLCRRSTVQVQQCGSPSAGSL
jgi:hypothetical protein